MNVMKSLDKYEQHLASCPGLLCGKPRRTSNKIELERSLFGVISIALLRARVANDRTR